MDKLTVPAAAVIDGRGFSAGLTRRIGAEVAALAAAGHGVPGLAVVLVGADPASAVYVGAKHCATVAAGMASFEHRLPGETTQADLLALIARLNANPAVHGILVQLPLPAQIDAAVVIAAPLPLVASSLTPS